MKHNLPQNITVVGAYRLSWNCNFHGYVNDDVTKPCPVPTSTNLGLRRLSVWLLQKQ